MYGQQSGRTALEAALVVLTALSVMYAAVYTYLQRFPSNRDEKVTQVPKYADNFVFIFDICCSNTYTVLVGCTAKNIASS
jgi:uncharacterized protein YqiB (DUF1249 family)